MTTAASVGWGSNWNRPGRNTSISAITSGTDQTRHLRPRTRAFGDCRPR